MKLNIYQQQRMQDRDQYIVELAELGTSYKEISKLAHERFGTLVSISRVHQIVKKYLHHDKLYNSHTGTEEGNSRETI